MSTRNIHEQVRDWIAGFSEPADVPTEDSFEQHLGDCEACRSWADSHLLAEMSELLEFRDAELPPIAAEELDRAAVLVQARIESGVSPILMKPNEESIGSDNPPPQVASKAAKPTTDLVNRVRSIRDVGRRPKHHRSLSDPPSSRLVKILIAALVLAGVALAAWLGYKAISSPGRTNHSEVHENRNPRKKGRTGTGKVKYGTKGQAHSPNTHLPRPTALGLPRLRFGDDTRRYYVILTDGDLGTLTAEDAFTSPDSYAPTKCADVYRMCELPERDNPRERECGTTAACFEFGWSGPNRDIPLVGQDRFEVAFSYLQEVCDHGSPRGCAEAGLALRRGRLQKPRGTVRRLFERACNLALQKKMVNGAPTCAHLEYDLIHGHDGPKNLERGFELASRNCELGRLTSCRNLGLGYIYGLGGLQQNTDAGIFWVSFACKFGGDRNCRDWKGKLARFSSRSLEQQEADRKHYFYHRHTHFPGDYPGRKRVTKNDDGSTTTTGFWVPDR